MNTKVKKIIPVVLILIIVIAIIIGVSSIPKTYALTTEDGLFEYYIGSDHIFLVQYLGNQTEVEIPNTIEDLPVSHISIDCFKNCTSIKRITIPKNLTGTFNGELFADTLNLEHIDVNSENDVYTSVDGILFNKELTTLLKYPANKQPQQESYTIDSTITKIGEYCFYGCYPIKNITIPASVTEIGAYAFSVCGITQINIPEGVTKIKNNTFDRCGDLETVNLPSGLTDIGEDAFYFCIKLETVNLPSDLRQIGREAFSNCQSLTNIAIPDSVRSIEKRAFEGNRSLTEISVGEGNAYYCSENGILYNKNKTTLMCYPCAKIGTSFSIPNTVTKIDTNALSNCENLVTISIPDSVTEIEDSAFAFCKNLKNISIPTSVTSFGKSVFYYCNSLIEMTIPSNIKKISSSTFYSCSNLKTVVIESGISEIDYEAFRDCTNLESITIPRSVNTINSTGNSSNLTIYGWRGSHAENYATEHDINFIELVDNIPPTISISPNGTSACQKKTVLIYADDSETLLADDNVYEYSLSSSNSTIPTEGWTTYSILKNFQIGEGLDGEYYLWIKTIRDKAGNKSTETIPGYFVSEKYVFDNTKPTATIATNKEKYIKGDTVTITVTFSEPITDNTILRLWVNKKSISQEEINQLLAQGMTIQEIMNMMGYKSLTKVTDKIYRCTYEITNEIGVQTILLDSVSDKAGNQMETDITKTFEVINGEITGNVRITGETTYGNKLTANVSNINIQDATIIYQWYTNTINSTEDGTILDGETSNTYTIGSGLVDKYIYVKVTATHPDYDDLIITDITDIQNNGAATVKAIEIEPTSSTNKTYNGVSQTSFSAGTGYTVINNNGINAGNYVGKAILTDKINTVWSDTKDIEDKTLNWSISKKEVMVNWGDNLKFIYDGNIHMPTVTTPINGVNSEKINLTVGGGKTQVGTYEAEAKIESVTGGQANKDNYQIKESTRTKQYTIIEKTLNNIVITKGPNKTTYKKGENFESSGMIVTASYNNGTSNEVSNYTLVDGNNLALNKTSVTISYTENGVTKTTSQSITVNDDLEVSFDDYVEVSKDGKNYVENIAPSTTIGSLINNTETNGTITVYKDNVQVIDNSTKLSTGMNLKVSLDGEKQEFTIVVKGDTNGDGEADLRDVLQINKHRLKKADLTAERLLAGDVNRDNEVNLKDLLQINKFRLGKISSL